MENEVLSIVCDYLSQYGIDAQQLALVVAGLSLMAGAKVSYKLGLMALAGAAELSKNICKSMFASRKPDDIEAEVLECLTCPSSRWVEDSEDQGAGVLTGREVCAGVDNGKLFVELLDGTDLLPRLGKKCRTETLALVRSARKGHLDTMEVLERERVLNELTRSGPKGGTKVTQKRGTEVQVESLEKLEEYLNKTLPAAKMMVK